MDDINIKQLTLAVRTIAEEKNLPEETDLTLIALLAFLKITNFTFSDFVASGPFNVAHRAFFKVVKVTLFDLTIPGPFQVPQNRRRTDAIINRLDHKDKPQPHEWNKEICRAKGVLRSAGLEHRWNKRQRETHNEENRPLHWCKLEVPRVGPVEEIEGGEQTTRAQQGRNNGGICPGEHHAFYE